MDAGALLRALKPSNLILNQSIALWCSPSFISPTTLHTGSGRTVKRAYEGLLLDAGETLLQLTKRVEDTYASITGLPSATTTPARDSISDHHPFPHHAFIPPVQSPPPRILQTLG